MTLGARNVKPASIAMMSGKGKLATLWEKKCEPAPQQVLPKIMVDQQKVVCSACVRVNANGTVYPLLLNEASPAEGVSTAVCNDVR